MCHPDAGASLGRDGLASSPGAGGGSEPAAEHVFAQHFPASTWMSQSESHAEFLSGADPGAISLLGKQKAEGAWWTRFTAPVQSKGVLYILG